MGKKIVIILALIFIFFYLACSCSSFGNNNPQTLNILPPTPVNDFQVLIKLTPLNFHYHPLDDDGSKLEINDLSGQPLNFWVEKWFKGGVSFVWVRIPLANTGQVKIAFNPELKKSLSKPFKVFDPVTWDSFKSNWHYSGEIHGRVSGQETYLMNFHVDTNDWQRVDISNDYANDFDNARWFVRKEFFIAKGNINFNASVDDDAAWALVSSNEIYSVIGGDIFDSDGENPYQLDGHSFEVPHFGRYIWAGRGQDGTDEEFLTIASINSGLGLIFTRKSADQIEQEDF